MFPVWVVGGTQDLRRAGICTYEVLSFFEITKNPQTRIVYHQVLLTLPPAGKPANFSPSLPPTILIQTSIIFHQNFSNSLLIGLQHPCLLFHAFYNAATQLFSKGKFDYATSYLQTFQWLPIALWGKTTHLNRPTLLTQSGHSLSTIIMHHDLSHSLYFHIL